MDNTDTDVAKLNVQLSPCSNSCKDCVFAVYDGKTQTSCQLGRTEIYYKQGRLVEAYDDEKEFYVINGTICRATRPLMWGGDRDMETMMRDVRREITIKVDLILHLTPTTFSGHGLSWCIKSIKNQEKPFNQVLFVNNTSNGIADIIKMLREMELEFEWKVVQMYGCAEKTDTGFVIDHVVQTKVSDASFYAIFEPYYGIPASFVADIDRAVNDDLEQFVYLSPNDDGQGETVLKSFHKYVGGNAHIEMANTPNADEDGKTIFFETVAAKARLIANADPKNVMIRSVTEICPNLKQVAMRNCQPLQQ